jgi:alkylhydroperoxidase family enzyme
MPYIAMIDSDQATGELAAAYRAMAERPMPPVYRPPHGRAPGIIRAHSLDPALMIATFGVSASLATDATLVWPARELVNAVTSRANQCLY